MTIASKKNSKPESPKKSEIVWSKPKLVSLSEIEIDGYFQSRADIPPTLEYEELAATGEVWPFAEPVRLAIIKGKKYLISGFTRCSAVAKTGGLQVMAVSAQMTREKAFEISLGENSGHGYRRTNADKAKAVRLALAMWPAKSANSIAKVCKVSHTYVGLVVKKLKQVEQVDPHELEAAPEQPVVFEEPFVVPDYIETGNAQPEQPSEPEQPIQPAGSPHPLAVNITAAMRTEALAIVGKLVRALDKMGKQAACRESLDEIIKEIG